MTAFFISHKNELRNIKYLTDFIIEILLSTENLNYLLRKVVNLKCILVLLQKSY